MMNIGQKIYYVETHRSNDAIISYLEISSNDNNTFKVFNPFWNIHDEEEAELILYKCKEQDNCDYIAKSCYMSFKLYINREALETTINQDRLIDLYDRQDNINNEIAMYLSRMNKTSLTEENASKIAAIHNELCDLNEQLNSIKNQISELENN